MFKNLKRLMPCLAILALNFASCSKMFIATEEETVDADFFNEEGLANANFSNSQRTINSYSATWSRPDGTVLRIDSNLQEGTIPVFEGDPTYSTRDYTYRFVRWEPEPAPIYSNAFYTAVYEEESKHYYLERDYENDGYWITGIKEIKEEVTLPDSYKGLPITGIYMTKDHSWNGVKRLHTGNSATSLVKLCDQLEVEEIILGNKVENISDSFFYESEYLTSVTFNNIIKEITDFMFARCPNLTTVNFGSGLEKVGSAAFKHCPSLGDIVFPESLKEVGSDIFYDSGVTGVYFPTTMNYIGSAIFDQCPRLKTVRLPEYVGEMGTSRLFAGCEELESVTLPKNLTEIKSYAFNNCKKLNNVVIPSGVKLIDTCAFYECNSLSNISLPEGVEEIKALAFYNCAFRSLVLPRGLKELGNFAIDRCANLVSVSLPKSLTNIGDSALYQVPSLYMINYEGTKNEYNSINIFNVNDSLNNALKNYESYDINDTINDDEFLVVYLDENREILEVQKHSGNESYEYTGEVPTKAGDDANDYAFVGWELTNTSSTGCLEFSPKFNAIEKKYSVTFDYGNGNKVQRLYNYGEAIEYPSDPENGDKIFIGWDKDIDNMPNQNFTIYANYISRTVPGQVYKNSKGRVQYRNWDEVISEGIVEIDNNVLVSVQNQNKYNSKGVLILPNTIKEIGTSAFDSVDDYYEIIMQNGVTKIDSYAFVLCDVEVLKLPDSITEIESNAFGSSNIVSITLPSSITTLPEMMFYGCNNLQEVILPSNLTNIDFGVFASCPSLTSISLPSSIKTYKNAVFFASGFTKIEINQGATSIGNGMFSKCANLTEVTLPSTLTSVGTNLFSECDKLTKVNFRGTKTQFNNLGFDSATLEKLASVTVTYNYAG